MIGDVYKLEIVPGEVLYMKELQSTGSASLDCENCSLGEYCRGVKKMKSNVPRCGIEVRFVEITEEEYLLFAKEKGRL